MGRQDEEPPLPEIRRLRSALPPVTVWRYPATAASASAMPKSRSLLAHLSTGVNPEHHGQAIVRTSLSSEKEERYGCEYGHRDRHGYSLGDQVFCHRAIGLSVPPAIFRASGHCRSVTGCRKRSSRENLSGIQSGIMPQAARRENLLPRRRTCHAVTRSPWAIVPSALLVWRSILRAWPALCTRRRREIVENAATMRLCGLARLRRGRSPCLAPSDRSSKPLPQRSFSQGLQLGEKGRHIRGRSGWFVHNAG